MGTDQCRDETPARSVARDPQRRARALDRWFPRAASRRAASPGRLLLLRALLAATAAERKNPNTRLRAWTEQDGLVAFDDTWPIGPSADFDRNHGRILVSSACDADRKIPALFEIDWNTRRRRELLVVDRPPEMSLSSGFYLRDKGVAVRSQGNVHVLARDGDRLSVTDVALELGDIIHIGVAGRLIVTPTAIWTVDTARIEQVAEFPEVLATCVQSFDGRVLRYTAEGCDRLIGPELALQA